MPELVDHAHTNSCTVIGCILVQLLQPRRKMNLLFLVAVISQLHHSRSRSRSHITVVIVNNAFIE